VRACRTGGDLAAPTTHVRSSSEPSANSGANGDDKSVGVQSELGHEEAEPESCSRRKPITLELFLR
jgi:hypothetical protein